MSERAPSSARIRHDSIAVADRAGGAGGTVAKVACVAHECDGVGFTAGKARAQHGGHGVTRVMGGFMGGLGEPEDHFLIFHGRLITTQEFIIVGGGWLGVCFTLLFI